MNKKTLSERDICTKFISPALVQAGWDIQKQVREEFSFTDGRIFVRGHLTTRGKRKRAYFTKYGETARNVLDALLDKYADEGLQHIEDIGILHVNPFSQFGSPMQIINDFGGTPEYKNAVKELEAELYREVI